MMFRQIACKTIGEGIEDSLRALQVFGSKHKRENQDQEDECREIRLMLDIYSPASEPSISRCICTDLKGLAKYDDEFLEGTGDNLGWKYTYHSLYEPYYDKVVEELKRNINTRRACVALGQGDLNFTNDPPCLQLMMFDYTYGVLEMTVVFRSNDAVKAFPMNIHAVELLHQKVAEAVGVDSGSLHYIVNNFHAYSKDYKRLEKYCEIFDSKSEERRFWTAEDLQKVRDEKID